MIRWSLLLLGVIVVLVGGRLWFGGGEAKPAAAASASGPAASAARRLVAQAAAIPDPAQQDLLGGQSRTRLTVPSAQAPLAASGMGTELDRLGLSRRLEGEHRLRFDERERQVLGSKDVVEGNEVSTIVYTRDVLSGQIDAWQAGLRFGLQPGASAEAIFNDHPALRRALVSVDRAEAVVEVDQLAAQYRALQADPRVAGVRLMPLRPRESPK